MRMKVEEFTAGNEANLKISFIGGKEGAKGGEVKRRIWLLFAKCRQSNCSERPC